MMKSKLETQIQEVTILTELLDGTDEVELDDLVRATVVSQEIMEQLLTLTAYVESQELKEFLEEMLEINKKLKNVTLALEDDENIASPNSLLKTLSQAFEKLTNNIVAKTMKKKLPFLNHLTLITDNVFPCFEAISSYWNISSREQKIAMVLGAVLITATVGLLIASNVAPALAGIAFLPEVLMGALYLGKTLYNKVTEPMKNKHETQKQVANVKKVLDEQQEAIVNELSNDIPANRKLPKLDDIEINAKWENRKSRRVINTELDKSFSYIENEARKTFPSKIKPALKEEQPGYMKKGAKNIIKGQLHKTRDENKLPSNQASKKASSTKAKRPRAPKKSIDDFS